MERLFFTFDEYSLESLEKIREQKCSQGQQDFREVIVRNPETREECVLIIPELVPEQK